MLNAALAIVAQMKKLQDSQNKTQAALKRKVEEHSLAIRKVTITSIMVIAHILQLSPLMMIIVTPCWTGA